MSTNMEADQDDISSMSGSSDVELSPPSIHSSSTSVATSKRKPGRKNHPVYRGVRERSRGKWVCEVREPIKQKRIWLGTHPTPEMAARAYDAATLSLRGDTDTLLNFPDSAWRLPRAISSSPAHIQVAAMEAAELFRPPCPVAQELVPASPSSQMPPSCLASEDGIIVDEEEVFNMPTLLADMAQGLLLPPPYLHKGFDNDDMDKYVDISLWNF